LNVLVAAEQPGELLIMGCRYIIEVSICKVIYF